MSEHEPNPPSPDRADPQDTPFAPEPAVPPSSQDAGPDQAALAGPQAGWPDQPAPFDPADPAHTGPAYHLDPSAPGTPQAESGDLEDEPGSGRNLPVIVTASVLALVLAVVLGYLAFSRQDDSPTLAGTSTTDTAEPTADADQTPDAGTDPTATEGPQSTAEGTDPGVGTAQTPPAEASGGSATQPAPGTTTGGGSEQIDAYAIKVGDCLVDPGQADTVTTLTRVSCDQPHYVEIFAVFDLPQGSYPGDIEVQGLADGGCATRFEPFVGRSVDDSALSFRFLTPTEQTWATGDREVSCGVFDPKGDTAGSLKNANR
ncbi:MAG: septum formation family protein [Actinomycetales bacterium]